MQANESPELESAELESAKLGVPLPDGRRMTLSLPPTDARWAADGIRALRVVPPTHTGRGQEPPALPERPPLPLEVALLGLGA
ncbi:hypothetical protein [Streptomyces sp. NPDC006134]|uniref:hypothetical protein n=1 Tax=Streptomyces sp. NPDC006134 TaxID=3154467 RepID=UPI0034025388